MARQKIRYSDHYAAVMRAMTSHGLLLGSYDAAGKPNAMAIGWGAIGHIWGAPVWMVLVRPSRYTHTGIEHTGCFTVNVPTEAMGMAVAVCGTRSGRDIDKFAEAGLAHEPAAGVLAPRVADCPIIYECRVVHSHEVLPDRLTHEILDSAYRDGDYHRVYYGKILAAWATPDAAERLAERSDSPQP